MSGKNLRIIEAFHIFVLLAFFAYIPFCFNMMLEAAPDEGEAAMCLDSEPPPPRRPDGRGLAEVHDHSSVAVLATDHASLATEGHEVAGGRKASCEMASGHFTVLPFLIALIGGGVFSLDVF